MSVVVKDQVRLSLGKCVELVLSGIRYRLFRAGITVAIIALAVAFLMTMLSESLVARRLAGAIASQTAPRKKLLFWTNRISTGLTQQEIADQLAAMRTGGPRYREFQTWGSLNDAELASLMALAAPASVYQKYFDEAPAGARSRMVGNAQGVEVFDHLQDQAQFAQFESQYREAERKFPKEYSLDGFRAFLKDWRAAAPLRQRVMDGHKAALEQFRAAAGSGPPTELLAAADDTLPQTLAKYGFRMSADDLRAVRDQARLTLDEAWLSSLVKITRLKAKLGELRNVKNLSQVDAPMLYDEVSSGSGARWLVEQLQNDEVRKLAKEQGIAMLSLSPERIRQVADDYLHSQQTAQVEQSLARATVSDGFMGFSGRTVWLIVVSFIVCVVGIANAMLMSVTERFREIATMKCLGATDGFIMINFILESMMQGVAGGVIGSLLGLLLGLARSWVNYSSMALSSFPVLEVLTVGGASLAIGVVISALAAVYPAWVAARLAPMEAMRIE